MTDFLHSWTRASLFCLMKIKIDNQNLSQVKIKKVDLSLYREWVRVILLTFRTIIIHTMNLFGRQFMTKRPKAFEDLSVTFLFH